MGLTMLWSDDSSTVCISVQLMDLSISPLLLQCSVPWSHKNAYCSSDWYKDFTAKGTTPHARSLRMVHCPHHADRETEAQGGQRVANKFTAKLRRAPGAPARLQSQGKLLSPLFQSLPRWKEGLPHSSPASKPPGHPGREHLPGSEHRGTAVLLGPGCLLVMTQDWANGMSKQHG